MHKKSLGASLRTILRNTRWHLASILRRQQTPRAAWRGIVKDFRKLGRQLNTDEYTEEQIKRAKHLVKKGRKAYNKKFYQEAEEYFRMALKEYPDYAWAHTYLGHALHYQGRSREAVNAWTRAARIAPDSEAASKARMKIQHIEHKEGAVVRELEDRVVRRKE